MKKGRFLLPSSQSENEKPVNDEMQAKYKEELRRQYRAKYGVKELKVETRKVPITLATRLEIYNPSSRPSSSYGTPRSSPSTPYKEAKKSQQTEYVSGY